jgi:hypothetical protein
MRQHERGHHVVQGEKFAVSTLSGIASVPPPIGRDWRVERNLAARTGLRTGCAFGATGTDAIPADRVAIEFERDRPTFAAFLAAVAPDRVGTTTPVTEDSACARKVFGSAAVFLLLDRLVVAGCVGRVGVSFDVLTLARPRWRRWGSRDPLKPTFGFGSFGRPVVNRRKLALPQSVVDFLSRPSSTATLVVDSGVVRQVGRRPWTRRHRRERGRRRRRNGGSSRLCW